MSVVKLTNGSITIINGNMGIGVTNPTSKFTINGDIAISGTVFAGTVKDTTANVNEVFNTTNAGTSRKFLKWLNNVTTEAEANWWCTAATHVFSTISTGTIVGGTYKYNGGVLLPDGRVVFVPTSAANIGIFNPSTNGFSQTIPVTGNYNGGVLLPDGRVVFIPSGSSVGIFDPSTNTFSTITATGTTGAYSGGVLLPDGRVVFVPNTATYIGIFDPSTNIFSNGVAATGYEGGVLLPDGRVVFVPRSAANIGIFDPSNTTTPFSADIPIPITGTYKYNGGVLLPDGRVLFVPTNAVNICIFNPSTNVFSTIAGSVGVSRWDYHSGVLLPDGRVLFVTRSNSNICIFDPSTNLFTTTAIAGGVGDDKYAGGVLLPDGRVIFVPYIQATTNIGVVSGFPPVPKERCLHPCFNKL